MLMGAAALLGGVHCASAQAPLARRTSGMELRRRAIPCGDQYRTAVETIGLALWAAPETQRPAIERLLNAAAQARELVGASESGWIWPLCSDDTLARLHSSVARLESNGWLPKTPAERREAETAAANAELLKAMDAGLR